MYSPDYIKKGVPLQPQYVLCSEIQKKEKKIIPVFNPCYVINAFFFQPMQFIKNLNV